MLEKDIEYQLVERVKDARGLVRKVSWPGHNGAPDRLVLLPGRGAFWVELKAPGAKCRPNQLREHELLQRFGQQVLVLDSLESVDKFILGPDNASATHHAAKNP